MKYKITYRTYDNPHGDSALLDEFVSEIGAEYFEIKRGFVSIWTGQNETPTPDIYINANDVLTIKPIMEEEK